MAGTTNREDAANVLRRGGTVILDAGELAEIAAAARAGGGDTPQHQDQASDDEFEAAGADAQPKPKTRASRTAPISDRTKARIRKLAREGMSRNAIAREVGVSHGSVTNICRAAKPPIMFDRADAKVAVEAKMIDLKVQRAQVSQMAVDEVRRLFGLLVAPHEVVHWDKDGFMHRDQIERPTSGDVKNYATAIGILTDKHLALVKHDADARDIPAVDKWLAAMGVVTVQA